MIEHESNAGRIKTGVQAVQYGARHRHTEVSFDHGGCIWQHDSHRITSFYAQCLQTAGELA